VLSDTLDALRSVALSASDGGGYFPALYARVTRRVIDEAAAGRFEDGERMSSFVAGFAARYLDAHRAPSAAPGCWRAAFDVAPDARLLVVQQLLLGINVHVNFDLPQAVVAVADRTGDLPAIRPDFDAVNDVLGATYGDVIGDLDRVTRWTGRAAAMGGGHLFNFSLRAARGQAWRAAVTLDPMAPGARRAHVADLDRMVAVVAYLITRPTRPFSWFAAAARHLEAHDPATVTRALLGPLR
jgi:hypothetical protein